MRRTAAEALSALAEGPCSGSAIFGYAWDGHSNNWAKKFMSTLRARGLVAMTSRSAGIYAPVDEHAVGALRALATDHRALAAILWPRSAAPLPLDADDVDAEWQSTAHEVLDSLESGTDGSPSDGEAGADEDARLDAVVKLVMANVEACVQLRVILARVEQELARTSAMVAELHRELKGT